MFDIEPRNIVDIIFCSVYCPNGGDIIKEILRGFIFSYLKEKQSFLNNRRCFKDSKPNP